MRANGESKRDAGESRRVGSGIRVALSFLVTAASLALALRGVPLDHVAFELTDLHPGWLLVGLAGQLASFAARAARGRLLLGRGISFGEVFWPQSIGLLITNLFPMRAGEAARLVLMSRRSGLPLGQVGATVLVENLLDVLMLVALLVALVPFMPIPPAVAAGGLLLGGAVGAAVVGLVLAVALSGPTERIAGVLGRRLPVSLNALIGAQWAAMLVGLRPLGRARVAVGALVYSVLVWGAAIGGYWAVIEAMVPGGSPLEAAFSMAAISLGAAVPSSPGGIGVYELLGQQALLTLAPARYSPSSALGIALVAHAIAYLATAVLGAIALARLGTSLGSLRAQTAPR
jgi:glycosyltransferase 2 family protein